ncbi:MAG: hypothetical protein ABTQ32_33025 [Myxococcaceae bacterium]
MNCFVRVSMIAACLFGCAPGAVGSRCGNGTLETDEMCEGFDLRGRTCVSEGFRSGQLLCSSSCVIDASGCSTCGDGIISKSELCDGAVFGGKTCETELGAGATGSLVCSATCDRISSSQCQAPPTLPRLNEVCSPSRGCQAGLVCDLLSTSPVAYRCRRHCDVAAIGTSGGCAANETCRAGGIEPEGATATPPSYVICPATMCSAGFSCSDAGAGNAGGCFKAVGICQ